LYGIDAEIPDLLIFEDISPPSMYFLLAGTEVTAFSSGPDAPVLATFYFRKSSPSILLRFLFLFVPRISARRLSDCLSLLCSPFLRLRPFLALKHSFFRGYDGMYCASGS